MLAAGLAKVVLTLVLTTNTALVMSQDSPNALPVIDRLWDYNDPAASEAKFRDLLAKAPIAKTTTPKDTRARRSASAFCFWAAIPKRNPILPVPGNSSETIHG